MMLAKEVPPSYSSDQFANFAHAYTSVWWASLRWFAIGAVCMLIFFAALITYAGVGQADSSALAALLPAVPLTILAMLLPASISLLRTLSEMLAARQLLSSKRLVKQMLTYIVGASLFFVITTTFALAGLWQAAGRSWSVIGLGVALCIGCAVWGWFYWERRLPIIASSVPCMVVTLVLMPALQSHLATNTLTLNVIGTLTVVTLILFYRWEYKRKIGQSLKISQPARRFETGVMQWMLAIKPTRTLLLSFSMVSMASQFVTLVIGFASLQAGSTFSGALLNACVLQVILESNYKIGLLSSMRTLWLPFGLQRQSLAFQLFVIRFAQLLFVFALFAITLATLSLVIDFPPMSAIDLQVLPFLILAIWVLGVSLALWNAAAGRSVFWSLVTALILSPLVLYSQYQLGIGQWQTTVVNNHALQDATVILLCSLVVSLITLIRTNRLLATKDLSLFLKPKKS
jgi:hypothetical protein